LGNFIGTDATGTKPLGNAHDGMIVANSSNNTMIGGTTQGAGNIISATTGTNNQGFPDAFGIGLRVGTSVGVVIQGNLIGTDVTGTKRLGNANWGVVIGGALNTTLGGTGSGARNIISGNPIGVECAGSIGMMIQGNYIGTDITGTQALGNGEGIYAFGQDSPDDAGIVVGGTTPGAGNLI